jgi:hypothetical protein
MCTQRLVLLSYRILHVASGSAFGGIRNLAGNRSRRWVQGGGREHLWRLVDEPHGVVWRAIEFVEFESLDIVEWIYADFVGLDEGIDVSERYGEIDRVRTDLEQFRLFEPSVYGLVVGARTRHELAAVNGKWLEDDGAIAG